jgi:hypothetical protein
LAPTVEDVPAPPAVVKKPKKSASDKLKKKVKDDGMVVPPINVLIVEGEFPLSLCGVFCFAPCEADFFPSFS